MVLAADAWARAHADFDRFRPNSITSVEFGGDWWKLIELAEFGRIRSTWQNLIKASEFICRVFHRDIPTVTGLVPLHKGIEAVLDKRNPGCSIVNTIGGKYLKALRRPNKGRKYNSNTSKNRNNRTKKLALLDRCSSR